MLGISARQTLFIGPQDLCARHICKTNIIHWPTRPMCQAYLQDKHYSLAHKTSVPGIFASQTLFIGPQDQCARHICKTNIIHWPTRSLCQAYLQDKHYSLAHKTNVPGISARQTLFIGPPDLCARHICKSNIIHWPTRPMCQAYLQVKHYSLAHQTSVPGISASQTLFIGPQDQCARHICKTNIIHWPTRPLCQAYLQVKHYSLAHKTNVPGISARQTLFIGPPDLCARHICKSNIIHWPTRPMCQAYLQDKHYSLAHQTSVPGISASQTLFIGPQDQCARHICKTNIIHWPTRPLCQAYLQVKHYSLAHKTNVPGISASQTLFIGPQDQCARHICKTNIVHWPTRPLCQAYMQVKHYSLAHKTTVPGISASQTLFIGPQDQCARHICKSNIIHWPTRPLCQAYLQVKHYSLAHKTNVPGISARQTLFIGPQDHCARHICKSNIIHWPTRLLCQAYLLVKHYSLAHKTTVPGISASQTLFIGPQDHCARHIC